jgi:sulfite exporter TauE/SafE
MDCCAPIPAGPLEFAVVFGTGLAVSLGHCLGMCGPLVVAFGAGQRSAGRAGGSLLGSMLVYHSGRLLGYGTIGALAGAAGSLPARALPVESLGAWLALAAGLAMLLAVLGRPLFPAAARRVPLLRGVTDRLRRATFSLGRRGPFGLGLANGFLPCGPVAAVALAAAGAGGARLGATMLLVYGLGTLPAMLAVAWGAASLPMRARAGLHRVANVLLVTVAFQLSMRGLAAFGVVPHSGFGEWMLW